MIGVSPIGAVSGMPLQLLFLMSVRNTFHSTLILRGHLRKRGLKYYVRSFPM